MRISRPICRSPPISIAGDTRSANGENAFSNTASLVCKTCRGLADRGLFPPEDQLHVLTLASESPDENDCPATRWSLDDLATNIINDDHYRNMSRSTIARILDDADLKPHRSVYWLNSHDPDFEQKAQDICQLYVNAPTLYQHSQLVLCCDEKTGMQVLERKYATKPATPGRPERREHEYIRHGTRALIASFCVATGRVLASLGATRTSDDFAAHLTCVAGQFPDMRQFHWILDNLNTHWSLPVCRAIAQLSDISFQPNQLLTGKQRRAFLTDPTHKHVLHFTPTHGSWLNQVELWFSTLGRRWLKRSNFASVEAFDASLLRYLAYHNLHKAQPYQWTYTGQPLVRGASFADKRRKQQHGKAWFGRGLQPFERLLCPPRPYNRRTKAVDANL